MKTCFDTIVAFIALLVFAPVFLLVALLILLEDGRPVLFVQERLGEAMRPFTVYKFRSMRGGRVTRVGRWIRATGLDELLQFFNVLQGSMSVAGPRPMTVQDVVRLGWHDPEMKRWSCKPGVTGLAQLFAGKGRQVSRFLDDRYARQGTIWLDLQVIALSLLVNCLGKYRVRRALSLWRAQRRNKRRAVAFLQRGEKVRGTRVHLMGNLLPRSGLSPSALFCIKRLTCILKRQRKGERLSDR